MRRLRRICDADGARPTFVFTSATVANPGQLASELTGLDVRTVEAGSAARGTRHIVLIDPQQGAAQTAIALLKAALARSLRTIVYTQSRGLAADEAWLTRPEINAAVTRLESAGTLRRTADGANIHACRRRPHLTVALRGAGQRYRIVDADAHTTIGEIDSYRLYREAHPGAIYLHQAQTFRVQSINRRRRDFHLRRRARRRGLRHPCHRVHPRLPPHLPQAKPHCAMAFSIWKPSVRHWRSAVGTWRTKCG